MAIIQQINDTEWYKQAGNSKAYYIFTCCKAAMKCLGGEFGIWALTNRNYLEAFLPKSRFLGLASKYLEMQKQNPEHIVEIMRECDRKSKVLYGYYRVLAKKQISKMSINDVKKALRKLDRLSYEYWCSSYYCDIYDPNGEELLAKELKRYKITLTEKELNIFMRTDWNNYIQEERLSLLRLKKKGITSLDAAELAAHTKKFFYVDNSWESTAILKNDDFFKRLKDINDADAEIRWLTKDWIAEQASLQKKHKIPDGLMNVLFYFRQLFILRDKRKKHTLMTNHYYDKLFMRLSELTKVPFKEMQVLLVEDACVDAKKMKEQIALRRNLMIEVYYDKKSHDQKRDGNKNDNIWKSRILAGGKAVPLFNLLQKNYGFSSSLRGQGASKGKATGIARIILGETHFSKFNEGEIIVAPMTRPEFVPLMRKAIAIVTDEGGITCHAAIISRELGIPCIVGTQKATSKLKDGMLIEVDADKGIIKVIKHMKLLSVQSLVDKELEKSPDIVGILKQGLLNITAAAEKFRPQISQQLGKDVKVHAIGMAIRRYNQRL